MKPISLPLILASIIFMMPFSSLSSQEKNNTNTTSNELPTIAEENNVKMSFSLPNSSLVNKFTADSHDWFEIDGERHLLLKRKWKGKKERGHVILFHTYGENPDHLRIMQPLPKQLSTLGWSVWMPNIAIPDFSIERTNQDSKEVTKNNESHSTPIDAPTEQPNSINTNHNSSNYFKTQEAYQAYFLSICTETIKLVSSPDSQIILVANEMASYWSIDCLKQLEKEFPVVFILPQAPENIEDGIDSALSSQNNPLLTFANNKRPKNPLLKSIENKNWGSEKQRLNYTAVSNSKLEIENVIIAKTLTGWTNSIRLQSQ